MDDEPLLFHTGMQGLFPAVRGAIESVLPLARLRWVAFAHVEADECGAFRELLAAAPNALPLCGRTHAMLAIGDLTDRTPKILADGERHATGRRRLVWMDAPHVPHGWDNGFLFEETTRTLLCGDLFTQPGGDHPPVTEGDVFGPSEALRAKLPYFALGPNTAAIVERLAATEPQLLACMHGSAWRGDGGSLLRALSITLPSLKPALVPAVILSVVWTFNMFNIIYLVSAGEPASSTEMLITQAYKIAFEQYQYAYAAAYSTVIFMILLVDGFFQTRITKATESF